MKTFLKQCLSCSILCIVLLASAVPFAVWAQSGEKTDAAPKAEAKVPADSKEITLLLEGKNHNKVEFIFEGNTIRVNNKYPLPEDITVDGKPWKDLSKPYKLDYTPDFAKAGILERDIRMQSYYMDVDEKRISLLISSDRNLLDPFRVRMALKNQLPHNNLPGYQHSAKNVIQGMNDSALYKNMTSNKALWDDGIKDCKIVLAGNIVGQGTFVFEGNTIRYQHESGDYPYYVEVNGQLWDIQSRKTFELPFQIDTKHPEIVKTKGENPVKTTIIDGKRFELSISDFRKSSWTHSTRYSVTITPGKTFENK